MYVDFFTVLHVLVPWTYKIDIKNEIQKQTEHNQLSYSKLHIFRNIARVIQTNRKVAYTEKLRLGQ